MDLGCALILLTCIAALLFGNWLIARPFLIRARRAGNQEAYRVIARALHQGIQDRGYDDDNHAFLVMAAQIEEHIE